MKRITLYGTGCPRCKETEQLVLRVLAEKGVAADVEKVTDIKAMVKAGILSTPAVAVDGVVKVSGRIPRADEIETWVLA
jgi:small redox-active disulfide protein 2